MPRKEEVDLGHKRFESKTDTQEHFSGILGKYDLGQTLDELDSIDVYALLQRHYNAAKKIGEGVKRIYVGRDKFGKRCFWLERTDGTETDFSIDTCIGGTEPSPWQQLREAYRDAIWEVLYAIKETRFKRYGDEHGRIECQITGELITRDEAQIVHMPPMTPRVLATKFILHHGIVLDQSMFAHQDGQMGACFKDPALADLFRKFHRAHGKLAIVKNTINPNHLPETAP